MSTIKHPVGPQSSKVYWRRRLMVGLGLLIVLAVIILVIVRPGSGAAGPASTPTPAAASAPAAASTAPAAAVSAPAAAAACDPAKITVEATTDANSYAPGILPQLSLSVTNTGANPCVINAGTSKQVFTVSSGKDVYWKSTDCQKGPADSPVTLKPGVPISSTTPIAWDRVRSSPASCDAASRDAAPAGGASYHLAVSIDGIEAATPKQFILN